MARPYRVQLTISISIGFIGACMLATARGRELQQATVDPTREASSTECIRSEALCRKKGTCSGESFEE